MTSPVEPSQPGDGAAPADLAASLASRTKEVAYVLFGLAAVFLIVPIALCIRYGWPAALGPLFVWAVLASAATLGAALVALLWKPDAKASEAEKIRLLLLCLGGTLGLLTAVVLGLIVPFFQPYRTIFAGGVTEWRKHPWPIFTVTAAFVGGLALTFASMQLARGRERESALMRRLMYGFNAVFSTLLLASILLILNLVPYMPVLGAHDFVHQFFAGTFDWTQARIYSLSDRTKNTLAGLKEPVKVYVFLDSADPIFEQVKTLLENLRGVNPRLTWEQIGRLDRDRFQQLPQKLQEKYTGPGLLVVYGDEAQGQAQFLPEKSLFTVQREDSGPRVLFKGEGALLQSIRAVAENAEKKPVVYFTQGDGELDFNGAPGGPTDGLGELIQSMRQNEIYDLKELKIGGETIAVPGDAEAVVVVQPQRMRPAALKAIYRYMGYEYDEAAKVANPSPPDPGHKAGKLFVALGVQVQDKKMLQTGLEPLLEKFGVRPGDGRVLTLRDPAHPGEIEAATSRTSKNPVAKAFAAPNRTTFRFTDVRAMNPSAGAPGPFTDEALVVTDSDPVWEEMDLVTPPATIARARIAQGADAKYSDAPIPLAVAVSERKTEMPNDMAHANVSAEGQPRLVAFGAAGLVSNEGLLGGPDGNAKYALFTSCLSWLREKTDIGATPVEADETKARIPYAPNISEDASWTLQLLPLAQMVLIIVAGGIGVWLVRRR